MNEDQARESALRAGAPASESEAKEKLENDGIAVVGPTNHHIFQSIYFRDPDGHRLELAYDTASTEDLKKLNEVAPEMMVEWAKNKKTLKHTAWLHKEEFNS